MQERKKQEETNDTTNDGYKNLNNFFSVYTFKNGHTSLSSGEPAVWHISQIHIFSLPHKNVYITEISVNTEQTKQNKILISKCKKRKNILYKIGPLWMSTIYKYTSSNLVLLYIRHSDCCIVLCIVKHTRIQILFRQTCYKLIPVPI